MKQFRRPEQQPQCSGYGGTTARGSAEIGCHKSRRNYAEEGSVSVKVFILLLFLCVLIAGGALLFSLSVKYYQAEDEYQRQVELLSRQTERVIALLRKDPTPEADSPADPVWKALTREDWEGCTVTLRDISSGLNPNWVRKNLFEKTGLKRLFRPGGNAEGLQQQREDAGFYLDPETGYGDFFEQDVLDEYFSTWSCANINITDEFALRKLALLRTGRESEAETFHGKMQNALREMRLIEPVELPGFLGPLYQELFPVIHSEPALNVHFLHPDTLKEIVAYPDFAVSHPESRSASLEQLVKTSEVRSEELAAILGKEKPHRLYHYLGVTTWFWSIDVEAEGIRMQTVLTRFPRDYRTGHAGPDENAVFTVVEKRVVR